MKLTPKKLTLLIIGLLLIDQLVKFLVKLNMTEGQDIPVFGSWFIIRFVENEGAAFGTKIGGQYGKLILSLFRIIAVGALSWYIHTLFRKKAPTGVIVGFSLILVGALGNIVDSAFYGIIFSESSRTTVAALFPENMNFGEFLHGKVVDMLYFNLFTIKNFNFFSPVFNIADSYITIGVFYLILFQRKYFK